MLDNKFSPFIYNGILLNAINLIKFLLAECFLLPLFVLLTLLFVYVFVYEYGFSFVFPPFSLLTALRFRRHRCSSLVAAAVAIANLCTEKMKELSMPLSDCYGLKCCNFECHVKFIANERNYHF